MSREDAARSPVPALPGGRGGDAEGGGGVLGGELVPDCAGLGAAAPTTPDLGIIASTDILAVDQASVDMVYALPEAQRRDLVERIESRSGLRQLEYMKLQGMGNNQYDLITL